MLHPEFQMLNKLASIFVNKEFLESFTIQKVKEKRKEWQIILIEKTDKVPEEIKSKEVSLNGYCKSIELMSHPVGGKAVYLIFKRRRWVTKGRRKSFTNSYDLHYPGIKTTKELADFLKELDRQELDEFFNTWPMYRDMWEKDTTLVQRLFKWFH